MKYVALLRGINVGGKNIIKMEKLKSIFMENGYTSVTTFIQSGNVIFETKETNKEKVTKHIENLLSKTVQYKSRVALLSYSELKKVVSDAPREWQTSTDIRCYVAFVIQPVTANDVAKGIKLKDNVDFLKIGSGVVYMTTLLSGITKSGFSKLIGTKVYQYLTIRNFNTTKKLLALMEKNK
jgi:uncharacterized protein (DUF1697 family)